ncbi:hypothetical protein [Marinactinospora rubrisoli]|uniref:Uncharacterized protein n=1 Tax=Marinactinospora rubrisoli TaxID=2715399 RepID=A0ABW2KPW9_9ACTN
MATAHAMPGPGRAGRLRPYIPASRLAEAGPDRIPEYVQFAAVSCRHRDWEITYRSGTAAPYRARHRDGAVTAESDDVELLEAALAAYRPPASARVRISRAEGAR